MIQDVLRRPGGGPSGWIPRSPAIPGVDRPERRSARVRLQEELTAGRAAGRARALAEALTPGRAAGGAVGKTADGLRTLGLTSVGALLEHLPRDGRDARTVQRTEGGRGGDGRRAGARDRRTAGQTSGDEAAGAGERVRRDGIMRATFFNQPWLAQRYRPGTRLVLHGKTTASGNVQRRLITPGIGVDTHCLRARPQRGPARHGARQAPAPALAPPRTSAPAPGEIAHYPASEGVSSTQILTLVQGARRRLGDVPEALGAGMRVSRATARQGGRAGGDALRAYARGARGGQGEACVRGVAAVPARVPAPPGPTTRAEGRRRCARRRR